MLRAELARSKKITEVLMNHAERRNMQGSAFDLFQTTVMLEEQVHKRTEELEAALHDNEKINRALHRTQEQMAHEIEQRRQVNEALLREKDEQRILIARLEQTTNQLVQAEKLASLGSLVAGVAHELNTPLGNSLMVASHLNEIVENFEQLTASGPIRKQALIDFIAHCHDAAAMLEKNTQRAARLIGNFKQVAVDQTSMRRRRFDLRQVLDEVLSTLRLQLKHTPHRLEVTVPTGIMLESYPGPIEQIIANLFANSLLHGFTDDTAGEIRISVEDVAADQVMLIYADNGVGINDADVKRVFDPFFTTKMGCGGCGLGLYIVYNLTTAVLGGTIKLLSPPNQGVRFEFLLPRVAPENPA